MIAGNPSLPLSLLYCSSLQSTAEGVQVKLTRLRSFGRPLLDSELCSTPSIEGALSAARFSRNARAYSVAMVTKYPMDHSGGKTDTLALLYEPRVTDIQGDILFIDGLEPLPTGETVFQQWRCELL